MTCNLAATQVVRQNIESHVRVWAAEHLGEAVLAYLKEDGIQAVKSGRHVDHSSNIVVKFFKSHDFAFKALLKLPDSLKQSALVQDLNANVVMML